jgi:hypothetical protein
VEVEFALPDRPAMLAGVGAVDDPRSGPPAVIWRERLSLGVVTDGLHAVGAVAIGVLEQAPPGPAGVEVGDRYG